jgi:mitochondrial-processing peptidase subunit alpha
MSETAAKIDSVTPATINQVARKIFGPDSGNKPTVVCMGKDDVGDWQSMFRKYGLAC